MLRSLAVTDRMTVSTPDLRHKKVPTMQTHFVGPPSSPPPTSPLPLPPISPSPISSIRSYTPPLRPPRPQLSLPDLRPETSDVSQRAPKNVHFGASSDEMVSDLLSPFTTPSKSPSQSPKHFANLDLSNSGVKKDDIISVRKSVFRRSASGRTWWSQTAPSGLRVGQLSSDQALDQPAPSLPPQSKKRRSKKPPQRAVARSALYIPPQPLLGEMWPELTLRKLPSAHPRSSSRQIESITSLPPLPLTPYNQLENKVRESYQRSSLWTIGSSLDTRSHHESITEKRQSTPSFPDPHISFCAVTNLEALPCIERPTSATHHFDGIDIAEQPLPRTWRQQHSRQLWIIVTVFAVLATAGGIMAGVIWRLTRPTTR